MPTIQALPPSTTTTTTTSTSQEAVYVLMITIKKQSPKVWRRIECEGDTSLETLHDIIQRVLGWKDISDCDTKHRHEFRIKKKRYGAPPKIVALDETENEENGRNAMNDEGLYTLEELTKGEKYFKFSYLYEIIEHDDEDDFTSSGAAAAAAAADNRNNSKQWIHEILVEKIKPTKEAGVSYPVCVTGRTEWPPLELMMEYDEDMEDDMLDMMADLMMEEALLDMMEEAFDMSSPHSRHRHHGHRGGSSRGHGRRGKKSRPATSTPSHTAAATAAHNDTMDLDDVNRQLRALQFD